MPAKSSDSHSVAIPQLAFVNTGSLQWLYFTDFDGICNSAFPSFLSSSRLFCPVMLCMCVCVCALREEEICEYGNKIYITIFPNTKGIIAAQGEEGIAIRPHSEKENPSS